MILTTDLMVYFVFFETHCLHYNRLLTQRLTIEKLPSDNKDLSRVCPSLGYYVGNERVLGGPWAVAHF